jgi:MoaA/NifB/PqqE/SkfB family radical SAM enzyme
MSPSLTKEVIDRSIDELRFSLGDGLISCQFTPDTPNDLADFVYRLISFLNMMRTLGTFAGGLVKNSKFPPFPSAVGIRELRHKIYRIFVGYRMPTHVKLDMTYRCQCKCLHCGVSSKYNRARSELSTEEWKSVVDQCIAIGATDFQITGGEALLRDDLVEIVKYVDKSKATCSIVTNGILATEEALMNLKDAGLYSLGVSLDHSNASQHDGNRQMTGCYEKAVNALRTGKELGLIVGINTYITAEEARSGKFVEFADLAGQLAVHELWVIDYRPTGRNLHKIEQVVSKQERQFMRSQVDALQERTGVAILTYFTMRDEDLCDSYFGVDPLFTDLVLGCSAVRKYFVVTAYGDVIPCYFTPFSFGNTRNESLMTIYDRMWSTKPYDRLSARCRILDPEYRAMYINQLDPETTFPVPFPG